ncbi:hypothetical protein MPTK1_4g14280 [Marchantia polymorpha subsp. ruderalis]|nr:hypothetical protein MARPO_0070s0054 [Marchantia polymorpha]BBN08762.1 hypothetical protein Mp_4g14280 [Marchantia polymorpha subsp. ruderalis]|eukprot:PTQ35591.1 hypothetical protein MARPO_0070s0054 [Marchantia polymorpha]
MVRERFQNVKLWVVTVLLACGAVEMSAAAEFDISEILSDFPDFSLLNQLLTKTKVAAEINAQTGITLFAPSNHVLSAFQADVPNANDDFMGDLLRHHVAMQFFDMPGLQALQTNLSVASLLQSAPGGRAKDDVVLIANMPPSVLLDNSVETRVVINITQVVSEISIIQVDQVLRPATFPSLTPVSSTTEPPTDITATLDSFGDFSLFSSFLKQTGVDTIFEGRQSTAEGITVFAPTDDAFNLLPGQWFQNFSDDEQRLFMEYHALDRFYDLGDLWEFKHLPVNTVATTLDKPGSFLLHINSTAGVVNVAAGRSNATITATLFQATPFIMLAIDTVLLPYELFGDSMPIEMNLSVSTPGPAPSSLVIPPPPPPPPKSIARGPHSSQSTEPPPPAIPGGAPEDIRALAASLTFTLTTLVASFLLSSSLCL